VTRRAGLSRERDGWRGLRTMFGQPSLGLMVAIPNEQGSHGHFKRQ
jgi:hypothetical protein